MHLPFHALGFAKPKGPQECACGHATAAHEHYRRGTDCALCECARYKAVAASPRGTAEPSRDEDRAAHAA